MACLLAAALSACGGGSGGIASTPTPPTPPAPTNATLVDLQFSQAFPMVVHVLDFTIAPPSGGVTSPPTSSSFMRGSDNIEYDAASKSYTVNLGTRRSTFGPANRTAASNAAITVYEKVAGSQTDNLVLRNAGPGNPQLVLTYASYGALQNIVNRGSTLDVRTMFLTYGIPTAPSDMPRTGSAAYTTLIDGLYAANSGVYSIAGASSFSADFGTGNVNYAMTPVGTNVVTGASKAFGTTNGTGSILVASTVSFLGGGAANALGYSSGMSGSFFGPAAAEMGAVFTLTGPDGAGTGAMLGRRN